MSGGDSTKKIKSLMEALNSRLAAIGSRIEMTEIQKGKFLDKGFTFLLKETLEEINRPDVVFKDLYPELWKLLADLTKYQILPSSVALPRHYLYEKTYYREWEEPKRRFIYKAFDSLYRKKGYKDWDDPLVKDVREEVETRFKHFYSIRPSTGWFIQEEEEFIGELSPENKAALELSRTLIRLFYFQGLAVDLLEAWRSYEKFVYLANPRYRDHFLHLIYDFLLGCKMLDGLMYKIHRNWKHHTDKEIDVDELRIRLMRSWMIAALFHDVGYAAESLSQFEETLQTTFFYKVPGFELSPLNLVKEDYLKGELNDFLTLLSYVFTEDEFSFNFNKLKEFQEKKHYPQSLIFGAINSLLADLIEKLDHGVMSALFLLLTLKIDIHELTMEAGDEALFEKREDLYIKERLDLLEDVVNAALAIALHNMRQRAYKGLTVDFRTHPISFLLMLCDDLHEWDREYDWKRTPAAFKSIYGFEVFPELADRQMLFADRVTISPIDGEPYEADSFFKYLKERVKAIDGLVVNVSEKLQPILPRLKAMLSSTMHLTAMEAKVQMREWVESQSDDAIEPEVKIFLKTLFLNLTSDIITLTYVGGDKRKRGMEGDRVLQLWETLNRLFYNNLSNGPAICILHGYENEEVGLFFTAEYRRSLKSYKVEKQLKPKPFG